MMSDLVHIRKANLSEAWIAALSTAISSPRNEISPLLVLVTGFSDGVPLESMVTRAELDRELRDRHEQSCQTVASTIFPRSLWNPQADRSRLFSRYERVLPRLKKVPLNRYGLYFERLIAFGDERVNQLDHIIRSYTERGNHRRSALQAAVMDPSLDHTHQRQRGFPCLQHVIFAPDGRGGLQVTGIYAMQYLFTKAYGNYLGLCGLGKFMAHELGLELRQMTCFSCVAKYRGNRRDAQAFLSRISAARRAPGEPRCNEE